MRIFGFLDQKRSKTIQILSQNFDCYGVIKQSSGTKGNLFEENAKHGKLKTPLNSVKKVFF